VPCLVKFNPQSEGRKERARQTLRRFKNSVQALRIQNKARVRKGEEGEVAPEKLETRPGNTGWLSG